MDLTGREKRALRSLAGRRRSEGKLRIMNLGYIDPPDGFMQELDTSLRSHELVNVRLAAVGKKAEAKELGASLATHMDAELVQTMGHTVLLFRPGKGAKSKIDLKTLVTPDG
ncbi:unnamed protein product [Discosporangium mesarthrocarpum]